ncbi:MAG: glycosyltransferase [Candidatus Nanoarchaeia archaeon]
MKILLSAPIDLAVSPDLKYAGTERIVYWLNQGLSEMVGHQSIVAASGNSCLGGYGDLLITRETHLWATRGDERIMVRSGKAYETHYGMCLDYALENGVDVIHDHPGQFMFSSDVYRDRMMNLDLPLVTTTHEPIADQGLPTEGSPKTRDEKYSRLKELQVLGLPLYLITLSESHRREHENFGLRVDAVVYNGIDVDTLPFKDRKQDYMLWLGRVSDNKGTDLAVRIARETKRPLIVAGEVHLPYKNEFQLGVEPYLTDIIDGENSEVKRNSLLERIALGEEVVGEGEILFMGPVDNRQKAILYQNACVTLQLNRWKESFGLVPVESMATGTPVIVTNRGALPELVVDGETGFVVEALDKGVLNDDKIVAEAIERLNQISRIESVDCRVHVMSNFSRERMARDYVGFYEGVA